jgi:hypothetical protein
MIRARDIIESVIQLNERNIINTDDIDNFLSDCERRTRDSKVKHWINSTLRKYLINDVHTVRELTIEQIRHDNYLAHYAEEPWVTQAAERGDKLYRVYISGVEGAIQHAIDYLNDVVNPPEDFPTELRVRDLTRISVLDAIDKAREWTEWLKRREVEGNVEEGEKEIVRLDGGFKIVRLTNEAALDLEGKLMQHCVGSYAEEVEDEDVVIYSLRDSSNRPHVTFEVDPDRKSVVQIKGKQNDTPAEKYRSAIVEFLNYGIKHDLISPKEIDARELERMDGVVYKGQVYRKSSMPDEYAATVELKQMDNVRVNTSLKLDYDRVKDLLDRGADPNVETSLNWYPVQLAMICNDARIVKLLLDYGADKSVLEDSILKAVKWDCDLSIFEIIEQECHPNWNNITEWSIRRLPLLNVVVDKDRKDLMEFLLKQGARPDIKDASGQTPLLRALSMQKDIEIIRLLLEAGADPRVKDNSGLDAFGWYNYAKMSPKDPRVGALLDRYK